MKSKLNKIIEVIIYFFTPEDSSTPIHRGLISFDLESERVSLGSAKALFWVMNSMIVMFLISLL